MTNHVPTMRPALAMIVLSIAVTSGLASMGGCSAETRYHVLSKIVEEVPTPEWVTPRNWREVLRQLPKEAAGGVDWDKALADKVIQPRSGLEPDAPDQQVLDLNIELTPEGQPLFKVIFSHKEHTVWLACANCHTGIFKMQRGGDRITMAKIYAGEYCGRCHGKVSFAIPTGCSRCHAALAGPAGAK